MKEMGSILFKLLIGIMIMPFVVVLVGGVEIPSDVIYKLFILIGFGIAVTLHEAILGFLTVPKVFLTRLISIGVLVFAFLYVSDMFIPGFEVTTLNIMEINLSSVKISAMELSKIVTMVILAICSGITYYLVMKLKSE